MSADGHESNHVPEIVDFDLLEKSKENVQPLATGRRVTALAGLLSTPHAQRESKLASTRNKLRINVEIALEDEDGDPLEAYCRLVYWTLENYPQGHSAESGILELLEEATRVLKDDRDGVWRRDIKYLKLWLLYASYVERPTIIYKFLIANEIGTEFALLYEEHAAVLERDGRRKEADDAYALGIARKASPLDHLEARYADFQKRMMSNMSLPPAPPTATPGATSTTTKPRPALAPSTTTSSRTTTRVAPGVSTAAPGPRPPPTAAPRTAPPPNGRIQVFVDPTGEDAQATPDEGTWTDLGTRKTRIKENVPEVKKLVGSTIKQSGRTKRLAAAASATTGSGSGTAAASSSRIVPFKDPPAATSSSGSSGSSNTTKPGLGSSVAKKKAGVASSSSLASSSKIGGSGSGVKGFVPFVDPGPEPAPATSSSASKSSFVIARDPPAPASSSAKSSFVVARDPPAPAPTPTAVKFTPFRDESAGSAPAAITLPVHDSIIKVRKPDAQTITMASEAEALRKDPLKNYSADEAAVGDD